MERLAGGNSNVLFILVNCSGPKGAPGFASQHKISKCLHFHQQEIPSDFGLSYIPHKLLIAADGTVLKNYDFSGTSLAAEVAKFN